MKQFRLVVPATIAILLIFVTGCASSRTYNERVPGQNGVSDARSYCESRAREHITRNRIDKVWRDHEYYRFYRQCYYDQTHTGQTS